MMIPEREPSRTSKPFMHDAEFVQFTAELLPPDSPEFQERARRKRDDRNPPTSSGHPDPDPPPAT